MSIATIHVWPDKGAIAIEVEDGGQNATLHIDDLPVAYNLYRKFGEALDLCQPGLTTPLPDNSPDLVDALKVIHEADRLRRENK